MTKELNGDEIKELLTPDFSDYLLEVGKDYIFIKNDLTESVKILSFMKDSAKFNLLSSVTSVDFISHFTVVYHLTSIIRNQTAVLKINCGEGRQEPKVSSCYPVWKGADLQEREIYDLMGIYFKGHPNLKRLLLWENFEGHPLRKDFVS
jgi:NADH-quinone oxidoreductase subunit C